jgi:ABC-type branched-subunit amino acid transport system ATPase component
MSDPQRASEGGHAAGEHATSEPVLDVDGLVVRAGDAVLLEGVSLQLAPGEVVGLVGPNGAGKTTLLDAITGFVVAAQGRIELAGARIEQLAPHERARRGMRRTFQDGELCADLTVRDHLALVTGVEEDDVDLALDRSGLTDVAAQLPSALDPPQRRSLSLARALVGAPVVAVLDEPAAGSGAAERRQLARAVERAAAGGTAVLLCDHDQELVRELSSTVHHLEGGRLRT